MERDNTADARKEMRARNSAEAQALDARWQVITADVEAMSLPELLAFGLGDTGRSLLGALASDLSSEIGDAATMAEALDAHEDTGGTYICVETLMRLSRRARVLAELADRMDRGLPAETTEADHHAA